MLTIDGSFGEGGGQILRTALSLSRHATTNIDVIEMFLEVPVATSPLDTDAVVVDLPMPKRS